MYEECAICVATGIPSNNKKVWKRLVDDFNGVQVELLYVWKYCERFEVLKIADLGTRYGERSLTIVMNTENIPRALETQWFYRHGARRSMIADNELCPPAIKKILEAARHSEVCEAATIVQ